MVLAVKNPPANAWDIRDEGLTPGLRRSSGGGHGNPLQYSCPENSMDRRTWRTTVRGNLKSWTQLRDWAYTQSHHQFSSVAQLCLTLCNPLGHSMPGFPVHHQLPELTHTHVHRVGDTIQPSHPLSSASPSTFNFSQNQGLFKWISSSHQVVKVLEFQLQHQSFQWTPRTDFL